MADSSQGKRGKCIRYILCGLAEPNEPINHFRLVAGSKICSETDHQALRVVLPDDLVLNKCCCDSYSTTTDTRPLQELGATPIVRINGKWIAMPNLWPAYQPHQWYLVLQKQQIYGTLSRRGYLPVEQYRVYMKEKAGD